MYKFDLKKRCRDVLAWGSFFVAATMLPSSVWASCLETPNSEFCMVVDAASSCTALSSNMSGCVTDSTGLCTIVNPLGAPNPNIVIQVTPSDAVGSVPDPTQGEVKWDVISGPPLLAGKEIDIAILLGATGGGTSAWIYSPGVDSDMGLAFQKNNGSYQKVNGIFLCSDFEAPPASLPRLLLQKTVMLAGGTCGTDDVENLSLKVGMSVEYCFKVENIGTGAASNVSLFDPDAPPVNPADYLIGDLGPSGIQIVTSSAVTISTQGETVNLATVSGDSVEDPTFAVPDATDTATINAQLALESCPPDVQDSVDNFFTTSDGFRFAVLLNPTNPTQVAVCVPGPGSVPSGGNPATTIECVDQCILKEECQLDPTSTDCTDLVSKCEPSGNWTAGTPGACSDLSGNGLPNCSEVIQDRLKTCDYKEIELLQGTEIDVQLFHDNPFCYTSCTNISDLKTCSVICF